MNIKTILLEEYVNFVDNTKKLNECYKIISFLIVIIIVLFLFFILFRYLNEQNLFLVRHLKNR